jgi:antitoxin PrlF
MPTATMTSKGQVTIPIEVRRKLKLDAGDKIDFFEDAEGRYVIQPKTGSIMEMKGILRKMGYVPDHVVTIEEMNQAVLDAVAEDYLRSVGETQPVEKS